MHNSPPNDRPIVKSWWDSGKIRSSPENRQHLQWLGHQISRRMHGCPHFGYTWIPIWWEHFSIFFQWHWEESQVTSIFSGSSHQPAVVDIPFWWFHIAMVAMVAMVFFVVALRWRPTWPRQRWKSFERSRPGRHVSASTHLGFRSLRWFPEINI